MMERHDDLERNGDEARTAKLLGDAGRPVDLSAAELEAVKEELRAEWRSLYAEHRSRPRWRTPATFALAASIVLVAALGAWRALRSPIDSTVPTSLVVEAGTATASRAGETTRLEPGDPVSLGVELSTEADEERGRIALRTSSGASIRLDSGSRVRLASTDRVELLQGAVYVDSSGGVGDLTVHTAFGIAREIGTQFEVRIIGEAARLRVREGSVSLQATAPGADPEQQLAGRGDEWTATASGSWQQGHIAPYDPSWQWVIEAGPTFSTEGRTVAELLEWAGREAGWEVRYVDSDVEATAARITYSGAFQRLRPHDAIEIALPAALLEGSLRDGVLEVRHSGARTER